MGELGVSASCAGKTGGELAPGARPSLDPSRERSTAPLVGDPIVAGTSELEALRQKGRDLEQITDSLPALVALIDRERRYRFVSAEYERWFGFAKNVVLGKHMEEVLGRDAYAVISRHVDRALSGSQITYHAELPYREGGRRFVEATYVPQFSADGQVTGFVAFVADVSERKRLESYRADAAARAEKLLKITAAIAQAVSPQDVFEALVDQVADALGATTAGLWLLDEAGTNVRLVRSLGYSDAVQHELANVALDLTPCLPMLDSVRRREPVFIATRAALLAQYPDLQRLSANGDSYRSACLPLMVHGSALGVLAVTIREEREQTETEREFLLLVARYAGQAIERLRLLEAERRSRAQADAAAARLSVLNRASRLFVDAELDLRTRLRRVADELSKALGGSLNVGLIEADGLLHMAAVRHPIPEAQELLEQLAPSTPLSVGEGVTGQIAATGQSVLIESIPPELAKERAAASFRPLLDRFPVYALIGAPLRARGRVIGTVTAARVHEGETYSSEDLHLLEELAERAALAIDNSRLYQETLGARVRAEQLYRFAQVIMAADRLETVFDAALIAIETALKVERSAILIYDKDDVMRFRAWRNLSDEYRNAVEGHSPWARDDRAPEPVLIADAKRDPSVASYLPLFRREGIGALAFVPLVMRGRLLGKFMLYYEHPHPFAVYEVETARAISHQLASVVTRFGAVEKLEETIRQNELLAGVLAHDLRNPLGAIMTAAQLLLMRREGEKADSSRDHKPLSRILSSGHRMKVMIEQLLDFTQARSGGGIDLMPQPTNLAELCAQAVGELELAHPEWKIAQKVIGDLDGEWDSDRLLQVLSNLVANAGQHGDAETGVLIKLDGTHKDYAVVEVHNRGAVPEELLSNLFDPFRSTRHRRDQSRGVGLGLFIVREIVRAHGGDVTVSSSEATGTTFLVTLPRTRSGPRPNHASVPVRR